MSTREVACVRINIMQEILFPWNFKFISISINEIYNIVYLKN